MSPQKINNHNTIGENIYGWMFLMDTRFTDSRWVAESVVKKGFPTFLLQTPSAFPKNYAIDPYLKNPLENH